jgi:ribonuclease BN (tRNA processing enzyme)
VLAKLGEELGRADMFESSFDVHEYADGEDFETAGSRVTPRRVLHYEMLAFGFRVSDNGTTLAYSGDSGPSDALPEIAQDADLFVCEATLLTPNPEGGTRGHLAAEEAGDAFRESGAKRLLLTHRPAERPLENGYEQAHDGFELDL